MASEYSSLRNVIALGAPKEAALYFERVFPFDQGYSLLARGLPSDVAVNMIPFDGPRFDKNVVNSLFNDGKDHSKDYFHLTNLALAALLVRRCTTGQDTPEFWLDSFARDKLMVRVLRESEGINIVRWLKQIREGSFDHKRYLKKMGQKTKPLLDANGFGMSSLWQTADPASAVSAAKPNTFALALRNLNLVDPGCVTWEDLTEFRKDPQAMEAMRDFRLFFAENLQGKDEAYVQDKLQSSLARYEATAKLWNFKTTVGTISILSNRTWLAGTASAASLMAGSMPAGVLSGAITVGSVIADVSKVFIDKKQQFIDRPLSYLGKVRELQKI